MIGYADETRDGTLPRDGVGVVLDAIGKDPPYVHAYLTRIGILPSSDGTTDFAKINRIEHHLVIEGA